MSGTGPAWEAGPWAGFPATFQSLTPRTPKTKNPREGGLPGAFGCLGRSGDRPSGIEDQSFNNAARLQLPAVWPHALGRQSDAGDQVVAGMKVAVIIEEFGWIRIGGDVMGADCTPGRRCRHLWPDQRTCTVTTGPLIVATMQVMTSGPGKTQSKGPRTVPCPASAFPDIADAVRGIFCSRLGSTATVADTRSRCAESGHPVSSRNANIATSPGRAECDRIQFLARAAPGACHAGWHQAAPAPTSAR